MATGKRKRKTKVSRGIHGGGGKVTLTEVRKVLLGGGALASFAPIGHLRHGPREDRA